jgi:DNA-binding HxlR family transcriptional regulator
MQKSRFNCPAEMTIHLIGGKWKVIVLWLLRKGAQRSGQLRSRLPGITPAAFSRAVRELEASGLVRRRSTGTFPPAVSYALTARGESLSPLVKSLVKWGLANSGEYLQGEFGMASQYRR